MGYRIDYSDCILLKSLWCIEPTFGTGITAVIRSLNVAVTIRVLIVVPTFVTEVQSQLKMFKRDSTFLFLYLLQYQKLIQPRTIFLTV